MADQYLKPYMESSVFISWINGESIKGTDCKKTVSHILNLAKQGLYKIVTSSWTLAEVYKRKSEPILDDKNSRAILKFFEHDYIEIIELTRTRGEEAHMLAREFGLKPTDSVHLACALRAKCDVFLTFDPDFDSVKKDPRIRIEVPQIIHKKPLPLYDQS